MMMRRLRFDYRKKGGRNVATAEKQGCWWMCEFGCTLTACVCVCICVCICVCVCVWMCGCVKEGDRDAGVEGDIDVERQRWH